MCAYVHIYTTAKGMYCVLHRSEDNLHEFPAAQRPNTYTVTGDWFS